MTSTVSAEKSELRRRFRFERSERSLGGDWKHLLRAREITAAHLIASYISYGDEPSTEELNKEIVRLGKTLLLPRTDGDGAITWITWQPDIRFEQDRKRKKLKQPVGEPHLGAIDVVIVPALRVDRSGVRLGQGGGSYDRALASDQPGGNSWKVALLHDEELSAEMIPSESHDVRMDAVALPEILVRFHSTRT